MIGWLIALAALAAVHKAKQSAASPSNTVVSVGVPNVFGVPPQAPAQTLNRESFVMRFQEWQDPNGPSIPVTPGAAQDYYAKGSARSDSAVSQMVNAGLQVINPADDKNRQPVVGGAVSGGGNTPTGSPMPASGSNFGILSRKGLLIP
jgi:hypothetical protein